MNCLKQMNQALDYIEKHLLTEMDYLQISRIAGCSEYHFRRMFSYLAGISLGEYIRLRKLSAAGKLLKQGYKVLDCGILLGYDSPDAFRKAFQSFHGITPSQAKVANSSLKTFAPLSFQLTIKGGDIMNYRIEQKEAFKIVGFKKRITLQFNGVNPQMESLTKKLTSAAAAELKALCNTTPSGILSVSSNFSERTSEGTELDQYLGVATTESRTGYDTLDVPASTWAVFTSVGPFPQVLQDTWAKIYAQWLPESEYQLWGGPELLWLENQDLTRADVTSEIWIPIESRTL